MKKLLTISNILKTLAMLCLLVAGIIFIVTATSGYLVGRLYNAWVLVLALLTILVIAGSVYVALKAPKFSGLTMLLAGILAILTTILFISDRQAVIGDTFIPVNYPPEFYTAVNSSITGIVFSVVAVALLVAASMTPDKPLLEE